jgi:hypothetical protein
MEHRFGFLPVGESSDAVPFAGRKLRPPSARTLFFEESHDAFVAERIGEDCEIVVLEGSVTLIFPEYKLKNTLIEKEYVQVRGGVDVIFAHDSGTQCRLYRYETDDAVCARCGEEANKSNKFQRCGKCRRAQYCSKSCQTEHWVSHKQVCSTLAASESRFESALAVHQLGLKR